MIYVETFTEQFVTWFSQKSGDEKSNNCKSHHVIAVNDVDDNSSDDDVMVDAMTKLSSMLQALIGFSQSAATLISPLGRTNMDIDCELRLKSSKMGVTLLIQGKKYDVFLGAAAVRKWVNKMENSADELMCCLSHGHVDANERYVSVVVVMLKKDMRQTFWNNVNSTNPSHILRMGKKCTFPTVRYTLIFLGNSEVCRLLGPSFCEYLLCVIMCDQQSLIIFV